MRPAFQNQHITRRVNQNIQKIKMITKIPIATFVGRRVIESQNTDLDASSGTPSFPQAGVMLVMGKLEGKLCLRSGRL